MKFGKNFSFYKIPEYSEHYLDYYSLKLFLRFVDNRRSKKNGLKKLQALKNKISSKEIQYKKLKTHQDEIKPLKEEENNNKNLHKKEVKKANSSNINDINNINEDYNPELRNKEKDEEMNSEILEEKSLITSEKKNEIIKRLEEISDLLDTLKLDHFMKFYDEKLKIVDEFFIFKLNEYHEKFNKIKETIFKMKEKTNDSKSDNEHHERDEFGYATSWKRALSTLYTHTSWLHSFHNINLLACQKIQKKAIKLFKNHNIFGLEKEFSKIDKSYQIFYILPKLIELRVQIKNFYAEQFTEGNLKEARSELHKSLLGHAIIKPISYLYIGLIIAFFLFYLFLCFNEKIKENSVKPFFPAFNFTFIVILTFLGVGINLYILKKYKINYLYIFEVEPKLRLGSSELLEITLFLLTFWCAFMICAKIVYNYTIFGSEYYLFPLIVTIYLFIFILIPIDFMYYDFRKGIVMTFIRNLFPFGKKGVRFRDFLFGDILTSLSKPLCSLALTFCLIGYKECRKENKRIKQCNRDTIACFILLLYPNFIRFTQCINRLYYTKSLWPHFYNLLKYTGGIINVIFTWLYAKKDNDTFLTLYIMFGIIVNLYQLFWDVYVDWGLGRINSKNFFLRDNLVYPKQFYYTAIFLDAVIRYSWTWGFIHLNKNKFDEWRNLFMSFIEIYRRIQWCIIRIENENTTNPEKYRSILTIPELPEF